MSILFYLAGVGSFICWILVLIQIFKHNQIGLGILGIICGIFAFIYGWVKAGEWGLTNIMLGWSGCIALQIVFGALAGSFSMHTAIR